MASNENKPTELRVTGSEPSGIGFSNDNKNVYKMPSQTVRRPLPELDRKKSAIRTNSNSKRQFHLNRESIGLITDESRPKTRNLLTSSSSTVATSKPTSAITEDVRNLSTSNGQTSISNKVKPNSSKDMDNNNDRSSRIVVPKGSSTPPIKDCLLSNVLRSARRSLEALREVRVGLSNLVAEDEELSQGVKKDNPGPDQLQLSQVAETITILSREAFVPAHRLNQTAISLYNAEDFLRYPTDIRTFDISASSRIKLPEPDFNLSTIEKLRKVVDKCTESYNGFEGKGQMSEELDSMHFTLMRAFQDLYTCTLGCQEVFKVLLYTGSKEKLHLQKFLLSLTSMDRSDMLTEVQDLRRLIDELVIFLEKLSWGSFVVYRLASGRSPEDVSIDATNSNLEVLSGVHTLMKPNGKMNKSKDPEKKKVIKSEKKANGDDSRENKSSKSKAKDSSDTNNKKLKVKKASSKVKTGKKDETERVDVALQLSGVDSDFQFQY